MYLLIDDIRNIGCDIIARTPEAGKLILSEMRDSISCLGIDHDLGTSESGYDVIQWAVKNNCHPKRKCRRQNEL